MDFGGPVNRTRVKEMAVLIGRWDILGDMKVPGILALAFLLGLWGCDFSKCPACDGKGMTRHTLCNYGKQDCGMCVNGTTEGGKSCTFCKGAGTVICQGCKGEGYTQCRYCKGSGRR